MAKHIFTRQAIDEKIFDIGYEGVYARLDDVEAALIDRSPARVKLRFKQLMLQGFEQAWSEMVGGNQ